MGKQKPRRDSTRRQSKSRMGWAHKAKPKNPQSPPSLQSPPLRSTSVSKVGSQVAALTTPSERDQLQVDRRASHVSGSQHSSSHHSQLSPSHFTGGQQTAPSTYRSLSYRLSSRLESGNQQGRGQSTSMLVVGLFMAVMVVLIAVTVLAAYLLGKRLNEPVRQPRFVSPTVMGVYRGWTAVSGARQCNNVTRKIFGKNGTIGDAAVATILCVCVAMPHRCGLGGGFVATYYNRSSRNATAVVVRPRAPGAAQATMYRDSVNASLLGAKAVATFGELMGYELLLNVTGTRVAWRDLFDDAIRLADNGVEVYDQLAESIAVVANHPDSRIKKALTNPNTTLVLKTGDVYYNKKLAETLRKIAGSSRKGRFFDSGNEIEAMVKELTELGGTQTLKDFQEFRADAEAPTWALLSQDEWLFTTPAPTSGPVLAFVVSVLDNFRHQGRIPDDTLSVHRLVEALKFGFARRFELGDPEATEIKKSLGKVLRELASPTVSQKVALSKITESAHSEPGYYGPITSSADDHGSGHVCIVAANGDALCLVSSINTAFGSHILSKATGIWYNNDMNDFSTPHDQSVHGLPGSSSSNEIRPGLRPVSSLCPTVVVDAKGDVLVAATATGGPLIISALAQVLMRSLWMGHTVKQAIDAGRVHNQLFPEDVVQHEDTADVDVLYNLKKRGHKLLPFKWTGTVVAIQRKAPGVYAATGDYRSLDISSTDGELPA